jgi:hypothetical protein
MRRQIELDGTTHDRVGKVRGDHGAFVFAVDPSTERRQIALAGGVLDVREQVGALTHQVIAPA